LFRVRVDGSLVPATLAGRAPGDNVVTVAASPAGVSVALVWDSVADGVGTDAPADGVVLVAAPSGGTPVTTNRFRVDNTSPPRVEGLALDPLAPGLARRAGIAVHFTVRDAEGQTARALLLVSTDGGATFRPATLDLLRSDP